MNLLLKLLLLWNGNSETVQLEMFAYVYRECGKLALKAILATVRQNLIT